MSTWDLHYGFGRHFLCDVDPGRVVASHRAPAPLADPRSSIAAALAQPVEYPPLDQCVIPDDRIVLVLERHTPCAPELIAEIWAALDRRGVQPANVTILQPGDFRGHSPRDPRTALPDSVRAEIQWIVHDPTISADCSYLAATASGERVYLSRRVTDADAVISVGPLGFDPILGYRGTHSVFYPGLSDVDAIRKAQGQGHDELTPDDPRPLRQIVEEVAWLLGAQMTIQVIPAAGDGIAEVIAGQADAVLERGKKRLNKLWRMDVRERPELVIAAVDADASGHTWAQLATALDAARRVVARDGRVLMLTELEEAPTEGIKLIAECRSPRDALQPLRTAAPPDLISATQIAQAIDWTNVYLLSRLDPQLVEDLCMIPLASEDEAQRLISGDEPCAILGGAQHTSIRLRTQ
ncbi:MAG: lactate racemase domain-containing protein [Planctomycetaceae bacterium]